jgi:hypothetical protein
MRFPPFTMSAAIVAVVAACSAGPTAAVPVSPIQSAHAAAAWGPEDPSFNLEVVLTGAGFGLVRFRQPNDGEKVIYLDTWVRDLTPNTDYVLQRAVDTNLDGDCTSASWLTLGDGLTPLSITTDERGTGRAALWRDVSAIATGGHFDIHFRVLHATTSAVVLTSACYEYVVSQ